MRREEACSSFRLIGVHRQGSYAHYCVAPQENVSPLPDGVSSCQAAALAGNGPVARAQLDAAQAGPGSTVLVIGAAGSLGATVAALAAFRGAEVIGVDRLTVKPGCLDGLPLRAALDGDAGALAEAVREITGGWGADCVIDNLGIPAVWDGYADALADMGRIVVSGAVSFEPLPVRLSRFYLRSQSLIGVRTGNRAASESVSPSLVAYISATVRSRRARFTSAQIAFSTHARALTQSNEACGARQFGRRKPLSADRGIFVSCDPNT